MMIVLFIVFLETNLVYIWEGYVLHSERAPVSSADTGTFLGTGAGAPCMPLARRTSPLKRGIRRS